MHEQPLQCPQCEEDLSNTGSIELAFCPKCRFPLMLIAGKYRLERVLAEGGFGMVYLAHHVDLAQKKRVIKVIKSEVFARESVEARFRREVQVTSSLSEDNEHIVRIYDDFGEQANFGHYYVMEYLKGHTLKKVLKGGALPLSFALHIFRQLCVAMGAAHKAGIVHRDLKPENIFLIEKGEQTHFVKVIDFGIAKPTEGGTQLTKGVLGTPYYMAPEQCLSRPIDERADIYALGIILYELVSGRLPFTVTKDEELAWLMAHISNEPLSLAAVVPELQLPASLDEVLRLALAKDPRQRIQSAESFWESVAPLALEETNNRWSLGRLSSDSLPLLPTGISSTKEGSSSHVSAQESASKSERGVGVRDETPTRLDGPLQSNAPGFVPSTRSRTPFILALTALVLLLAGFLVWKRALFSRGPSAQDTPDVAKPLPVKRSVEKSKADLPGRSKARAVVVRRVAPKKVALVVPVRRPLRLPAPRRLLPAPRKRRTYRRIYKISYPRGDRQRTGYYLTAPIVKKPVLVWRFSTGGKGRTAPAVAHNLVYVGTHRKNIFALDRKTGQLMWARRSRGWVSPRSFSHMTLTVVRKLLYVTDWSTQIRLIDAIQGSERGAVSGFGNVMNAPLIYRRHIFFGTSRYFFYGFDRFTNSRLWSRRHYGGRVRHAASQDRNLLFYGHPNDYVYARELTSGKEFWSVKLKSDVTAAPVVSRRYKMLICSDAAGWVHGIEIPTGKIKWQKKVGSGFYLPHAVARGVAVFVSSKGVLTAVKVKSGKIMWKRKSKDYAMAGVSVVGGVVYYGSSEKHVIARSLWSGRLIWKFKLGGYMSSSPTPAHGMLFVHASDGVLYALRSP